MPTLEEFGDLVIGSLEGDAGLEDDGGGELEAANPPNEAETQTPPVPNTREAEIGDRLYFISIKDVSGYSDLPIWVGNYSLASAVDAPLRRFYRAIVIAVAILAVTLIAAGLMGRAISRPILRAAAGATVVGALDFDKVKPLPRGRFREINDLARSFNAMLVGLKSFGRYVPRTLVTRLITEGRVAGDSEVRELAIMFTDIAGFTATCENLSATEVADFINHHLTVVSACIEREGGTIDKYIGDAVMAFWGAPNRVENPAASACRAAVAIARAIAADNAKRGDRQLKPLQVRVGIHMGPVVVGDIGAPSRINYTIVGDAVNATQRLESLGKTVDPRAEVIVLISRRVKEALPSGFELHDRGSHTVKGKHESLDVYQLADGPTEA